MKAQPDTIKISDLLELRRNKILSVNAEYQRGEVWKLPQKKRLIDSVLRGYHIPLIYLHHIARNVAGYQTELLEVIDGQQRINSLYEFHEGAFKVFDPVADERAARFPEFLKHQPCPWGGKDFRSLPPDLQEQFLNTELSIVRIETEDANEARDLFIRLQAGMPLNAQEKRDAWPGNFAEFILKTGGKPDIARYPGHDFFPEVMRARRRGDRGKIRQLTAQMAMLYLTRRRSDGERLCDINTRSIDDFYYQNLDFAYPSEESRRFEEILDKLTALLRDQKRARVAGHEAIHLVLLVDSLWDDYTRSWEACLVSAFDSFRERFAQAKKTRHEPTPDAYWLRYGMLTRANSDRADTIRMRHTFFVSEMVEWIKPQLKDPTRAFGRLEREIIYYRDKKACARCDAEVPWNEAEIHHVRRHAEGGRTVLENGALVHKHCHPKSKSAEAELAQKVSGRTNGGDESV